MTTDEIVSALNSGAVLSLDEWSWQLSKAHHEEDCPARFFVDDDSMLSEERAWWDSIYICSNRDTPDNTLIDALAQVAGLRIRRT